MGPFKTKSLGRGQFTINFTEVYSRQNWCKILKAKSEAFEAYQEFNERFKTQHNLKIKNLRSDNGGEYLSTQFQNYLKQQGTIHQ